MNYHFIAFQVLGNNANKYFPCFFFFFFLNLVLHIKSGYPFQDNFLRFFGKRTRFVNNFLVVPMITLNKIYHYHHLHHPQIPLKT